MNFSSKSYQSNLNTSPPAVLNTTTLTLLCWARTSCRPRQTAPTTVSPDLSGSLFQTLLILVLCRCKLWNVVKRSRVFNFTCVVVRSELLRISLWLLSIVIVWFALAWLGADCGCLLLPSGVVSPAPPGGAAAHLMINATLVRGVMTCTARHRYWNCGAGKLSPVLRFLVLMSIGLLSYRCNFCYCIMYLLFWMSTEKRPFQNVMQHNIWEDPKPEQIVTKFDLFPQLSFLVSPTHSRRNWKWEILVENNTFYSNVI